MSHHEIIRVLVVDDEGPIREAYRELLATRKLTEVERLRARLFESENSRPSIAPEFEIHTADRAEAAVQAFRACLDSGRHFDVVFLDMRMPPGPDGAWAATQIRAMDPGVHMVIATAYSDLDPEELSGRIPPAERLFYLQKPFHAHEVRQLAVALGRKARAEAHVQQLAYFDSLTGLPNRDLMREQMSTAIALAKRHARRMAVLFIDLDNFKRINDTLGHSVGDEILKATAHRLREATRHAGPAALMTNQLARMGGDEFLVLLPETAEPKDAAMVAASVAKALAAPMQAGGHELFVTASIGIAMYPSDGDDKETLLRNADLAMYFAKRDGRTKVQYYDAQMNATSLKRLTMEGQLRGAIDRCEFSLHYQPQIDLRSGRVCGMEGLLRWNNAELGHVPPLEFIPVAEECGLIDTIGDWVLHTACAQARAWLDAGLPLERMAVNVSAVQLAQPNFIERVAYALQRSGLDPSVLELELTEGALIANIDRARQMLDRIKALNVQIAIDDFGVGYSSMNHLKELSVDRLKMDRSFISSIDTVKKDRTIAAAIISMAQSMNLRVTAEGVEDYKQLSVLQSQHCDEAQGFYLARPMPAEEAEAYLRTFIRARAAAG
ncbi:MAG: putative bifunctional diguanylate cyclase/phosphodiesterase [Gammaproteobacteria bacterium]